MSCSPNFRPRNKSLAVHKPLAALLWIVALAAAIASGAPARADNRSTVDLSGSGWKLWFDRAAEWKNDELYFPALKLNALPAHPPSGGWDALSSAQAVPVGVPGTVEEYLQTTPGPDGDLVGVSWWFRSLEIPANAAGRRVLLRFESVRERAEVFVNRQLVAYDVVGSTPVEVDITSALKPGERAELAVRITDPGGNFDWRDSRAMHWGEAVLPISHGFGGITGRVRLVICDPVYVSDLAVLNTPEPTTATALITLNNATNQPTTRDVEIRVFERGEPHREVFHSAVSKVSLQPGEQEITVKISAPDAHLWDLDHPNLYVCQATLRDGGQAQDSDQRIFGFRWFNVDGVGSNAVFRLNGKRIVLRTAISWGFWPINGIFPTEELAERQVRVAKELGLNMLNFHRAIGNPLVLEKADEVGLLYFEEPGAYKAGDGDAFGRKIIREKLLRMVRRDRSHPSLVIYNLINEWDSRNPHPDPAEIARHREDLELAHRTDPSRLIVHTSAWARSQDIDDPAKMHLRPYDDRVYLNGWYDVHHAGGPAVYNESLYRNPDDYYLRTDDTREIVYWGEEGAISTPPRLEKIHAELAGAPHLGWDGAGYEEWHGAFESFLDRKNLRGSFGTLDAFTKLMGNVSLYHQGRRIENIRLSNVSDGYAINGWESELIENHSGIVDCFRNPKGDPKILAHYNQPLFVAVKTRNSVVQSPAEIAADFYLINEVDLHGSFRLKIQLSDQSGGVLGETIKNVEVKGGETYGELLVPNVTFQVPSGAHGNGRIEATLIDTSGATRASGYDAIFMVDGQSLRASGSGAVWESGTRLKHYLGNLENSSGAVPAFDLELPVLDWIVVSRAPGEGSAMLVPTEVLAPAANAGSEAAAGKFPPAVVAASRTMSPATNSPAEGGAGAHGLSVTFFKDREFTQPLKTRIDPTLSFAVDSGATPDSDLPVMSNYGVRWAGTLTPRVEGKHTFSVSANGRGRLLVNGKTVLEFNEPKNVTKHRGDIVLRAGMPATLELELAVGAAAPRCELSWIEPDSHPSTPTEILDRVQRDGTTLVILDGADAWLQMLAQEPNASIRYNGSFRVGKTWLGGIHFAKRHPLFRDLPVDGAMDWPYQRVVQNGEERLGLLVEGEELAAGCYHSFPMQLGTVVGVFPLGRGHVIFSTLEIAPHLSAANDGPSAVARKLLCNYLDVARELHASAAGREPSR
ncbi:MAG TPA: PA14 domain-containing protein [Opitutaceae bacterium]|nr:PA14 domain-containing protein [Opitutaceae bacterium]